MKNAVSLFAQIGKTYWQHKKIVLFSVLVQCIASLAIIMGSRALSPILAGISENNQISVWLNILSGIFLLATTLIPFLWNTLLTLIPLSLIFSKEHPDCISTKSFLSRRIPDILKLAGLQMLAQIPLTIAAVVIPAWFDAAYAGDIPSFMEAFIYLLNFVSWLFYLFLTWYAIPLKTAKLSADQKQEEFGALKGGILWLSFVAVPIFSFLLALMNGIPFPAKLIVTALTQLNALYLPILFYRALLPITPFYDPIAEMEDEPYPDGIVFKPEYDAIDIPQQADDYAEPNDDPDFDDTALIPEDESIDIPQQKEE